MDPAIEVDETALTALLNGPDMTRACEQFAAGTVARAVMHTGNDSGALRQDMRHHLTETSDGIEIEFGTSLEYGEHHWAPGNPAGPRAGWAGTQAWTKALAEQGISWDETRGYPL